LISKFPGTKQDPAAAPLRSETLALKLVFFIVDWNQANVISSVFLEEKVRFHYIAKARGTASSDILDILGIGASDKAVVTCLEQSVGISVLLKEVQKKVGLNRPGAGIAFTVPLSAINDPVLLVFKQSIYNNAKIAAVVQGEGGNMADEIPRIESPIEPIEYYTISNDLIISIVNQGYSDELMNTAREAGASGGTVLNARGQAHEGAVKFFGISVQDEKELILILTDREKKVAIMRAICEAHGLNSKAQGIVFSLPVDHVMGLSFE
jgi:nitrogen regulatory protein PII